jgi:hypothetical protein
MAKEMTNNGANGVLMPVVDGKVGPAIRLQQRQLEKLTLLGLWLLAVAFAGVAVSWPLLSAGRPRLAATIPNRRCGQKYRLPNCRQRVSNPLTFITFLWYTRRRSGCLFIDVFRRTT